MLLISKIRKNNIKKKSLPDGVSLAATPPVPRKKDGFSFQVHKSPIPLDRVTVVEIESKRAAGADQLNLLPSAQSRSRSAPPPLACPCLDGKGSRPSN